MRHTVYLCYLYNSDDVEIAFLNYHRAIQWCMENGGDWIDVELNKEDE
mgnify:CR=1 FL=1